MTDDDRSPLSPAQQRDLIARAQAARELAYTPYSGYPVGAALLTASGAVFTGCNVEIASFGGTICAERTAAVKAVSEGERAFRALAVVTSNGASPCGICRQVLYEFGPTMTVITADTDGTITWQGTLADLLPRGFGPLSLIEGQAAADAEA